MPTKENFKEHTDALRDNEGGEIVVTHREIERGNFETEDSVVTLRIIALQRRKKK